MYGSRATIVYSGSASVTIVPWNGTATYGGMVTDSTRNPDHIDIHLYGLGYVLLLFLLYLSLISIVGREAPLRGYLVS